jgi:nicotinamidase-related amidase
MKASLDDPHGNAPDRAPLVLLLIDVINDFDFPEAGQLLRSAQPMAENIAVLKQRAKDKKIPVIYVNDNFGRWQSDFKGQVHRCLKGPGKIIVERLSPSNDDYFVLKPKHSGFYSTALDVLLEFLGTKTLILTGLAADICVLFTANDGYMRGYQIVVPSDCVASNTQAETDHVIKHMQKALKADVRLSTEIDFSQFVRDP